MGEKLSVRKAGAHKACAPRCKGILVVQTVTEPWQAGWFEICVCNRHIGRNDSFE